MRMKWTWNVGYQCLMAHNPNRGARYEVHESDRDGWYAVRVRQPDGDAEDSPSEAVTIVSGQPLDLPLLVCELDRRGALATEPRRPGPRECANGTTDLPF